MQELIDYYVMLKSNDPDIKPQTTEILVLNEVLVIPLAFRLELL